GSGVPSLDDSSFLSTVDPRLARPILEAFASSMSLVFLAAAGVLVIGLIAVCKMKEVPLRAVSGVEARRAAQELAREATVPPGASLVVPAEAVPAASPERRRS